MSNRFEEICGICGFTFGSHCGTTYYSTWYKRVVSFNCCPTAENNMDWSKLPETTFKPTGRYNTDFVNKRLEEEAKT